MSLKISPEEVKRIAALARLGLTEDEAEKAAHNLKSILDHFSRIQGVDTNNAPVTTNTTGLSNIMRDDVAEVEVLCATTDLLSGAPKIQNNQIKVKAVFD